MINFLFTAKKADSSADTSAEEHKIDLLVYHLYGLTFDEAKLIELESIRASSFSIRKSGLQNQKPISMITMGKIIPIVCFDIKFLTVELGLSENAVFLYKSKIEIIHSKSEKDIK